MPPLFELWLAWLKLWAAAQASAQDPLPFEVQQPQRLNEALMALVDLLPAGDEVYLHAESHGRVTVAWTHLGETFDYTAQRVTRH